MLSGIINQTELLRNKEKPAFFVPREQGDMTVKCKAGVTVASVIEPLKAFAMETAELKNQLLIQLYGRKGRRVWALHSLYTSLLTAKAVRIATRGGFNEAIGTPARGSAKLVHVRNQ